MDRKFLVMIIFLFFVARASAFGITPAQSTFEYVSEKTVQSSFEIVNSEHNTFDLVLFLQGELNASVLISDVSVHLDAKDNNKKIFYDLIIPSKLSPGPHEAEIVVLNMPSKSDTARAFIGAVVGLVHKIHIDVPYPGKYAESSLSITTENSDILFVFPVVSRGKQDIARAKAIIDIYTPLNEKIATVVTEEIAVPSELRREIVARWNTIEVKSGKYLADATVIYDESTITLQKEFSVGEQTLKIKNVEVNDFTLGGIAKFEFLVENTWNTIIKNAYVQMQILNQDGSAISDFKSATYDISPFESKILTAFWDTEGIKKGQYDSRALLKFGEQSLQHDFELEVSDEDINIVGVGYVISKANKGSSNALTTILITLIALLVIVNLLWFLILRKRMKGVSK